MVCASVVPMGAGGGNVAAAMANATRIAAKAATREMRTIKTSVKADL